MEKIMDIREVRYGFLGLVGSFLLFGIVSGIFDSEVLSLVMVLSVVICACTAKVITTIERATKQENKNSEE